MKTPANQVMLKVMFCALALSGLTITAQAGGTGTFTTVGTLDANGTAYVDSPANSAATGYVSEATMTSLVSSAFTNNTGGVITFDTAQGWANSTTLSSANLTYGTSGTSTLTMTETAGTFGGAVATSPYTVTMSGTQYMAFGGQGTPINFTLATSSGLGVTDWGAFLLYRGSTTAMTLSFTLSNSTTVTYSPDQAGTGGTTSDIWVGYQAPTGDTITGVSITDSPTTFLHIDDVAFVTASATTSVPEPSTIAMMLGGASVLLVFLRRRRSS